MKTTIEIPDDLFRRAKATAALRDQSLKDFVTSAIAKALEEGVADLRSVETGWRMVAGRATLEQVQEVDQTVAEEFGQVNLAEWK